MSKQKGQAMVEFALIVPGLIFLFLALLYGGILFMDYLQYNNAARAIARDVAFADSSETINKDALAKKYFNALTNLYTPTLETPERITDPTTKELKEVKVTIHLKRAVNLGLFDKIHFPPKNLVPIVYIMPVESADKD